MDSLIWNYFTISRDDESKVHCNTCQKLISRGGKDRHGWGHKGMRHHLATHTSQQIEFQKLQKARDKEKLDEKNSQKNIVSAQNQKTLEDSFVRIWDINDSRAQRKIKIIAEFICIGQQPINIVDNKGFLRLLKDFEPKFKCPSRHYFADKILPSMYESVKKKIGSEIDKETDLVFTCDIWSSAAVQSYISLTCHILDENFVRKEFILCCSAFPGEHTALRVAEKVKSLLHEYDADNKVHLILRDGGRNMVAAFRDYDIPSVSCLAHVLQNVVHEGIMKGENVVTKLLAAGKRLVGHFRHSPKCTEKLNHFQKSLDFPEHKLIQSEPTRWNTDYYMLERLLEQRMPIYNALMDIGELSFNLRDDQWTLASHVVSLLKPFEEVTRKLSDQKSCISEIIPFVEILKRAINTSLEERKLLESLGERTNDFFKDSNCLLATALDPRFKFKFFDETIRCRVKNELHSKILDLKMQQQDDANYEPSIPEKRRKNNEEPGTSSSFDTILNEIVGSNVDQEESSIESQINAYLAEKLSVDGDILDFWRCKKNVYPYLSAMARKYLAAPPTSVPSERLFSLSGLICSDNRTRLSPDRLEMLVYLSKNLRILNYQY